jgi:hypothetical protein
MVFIHGVEPGFGISEVAACRRQPKDAANLESPSRKCFKSGTTLH